MALTLGKLRGLQQLADDNGFLTICAMDHRGALQRALNEKKPESVSYQDMVDFKLDLCRAVTPFVSAVLLDPVYGAAQAIAAGVLPGHVGLLVSIEKTGYSGRSTARITRLLPGWGVKKAKRIGASAVKLLVYFRPDLRDLAARLLDLVAKVADDCIKEDIPLLVEPLSYPIDSDKANRGRYSEMKPDIVIETARQITALPIDILKAEFPADISYEKNENKLLSLCQQLNEASRLPWVLLSAGVSFDLFKKEVEIASKAGASGFLAGRAIWQEASYITSREERLDYFKSTSAPRLKELADLVCKYGKPWYAKIGVEHNKLISITEDWYKDY